MRLKEIAPADLRRRLAGAGVDLRLGPFTARVSSSLPEFTRWFPRLYGEHPVVAPTFADFHVSLDARTGPRRWFHPQALFRVDGRTPFHPLPRSQAVPFFEWGLNWCVATRAHGYLIFHAAVLERHGRAVLLPGEPGAGKSTLCAALAFSGWRLLSDELGLLDMEQGTLYGLARPVNLKNESIRVIRDFVPGAVLSDPCTDTNKGTVALLAPPEQSVHRVHEPAQPSWVITPQFEPGSPPVLEDHSKGSSFMELAHNAFNYSILGARAFHALAKLIDRSTCHHFRYSRLDDAVRIFNALADDRTTG